LEKTAEEPNTSNSPGNFAKPGRFAPPNHFTAMLFDDYHLDKDTLPQLREATLRRLYQGLNPSQRIAIFTTSGTVSVDFTDDRAKLTDAVNRLKWNPQPGMAPHECPNINHRQANLIANRHDLAAIGEAVSEAMYVCGIKDPHLAEKVVMSDAERVLAMGDIATRSILKAVAEVIARLSAAPGQRNLLILSPGFLISDAEHSENRLVDLAVRNRVVISSLDSKGVLSDDDDAADQDALGELADGTGGTLYRNNNNLEEGIRRLSVNPESRYVLVFSPRDLKFDGAFHEIKVKIVGREKLSATWRKGYFAPKNLSENERTEDKEIVDAIFGITSSSDLPIEMRTQFISDGEKPVAKLSVLALLNLQDMSWLSSKNENRTELRAVAVIFDRNGKSLGAMDRKIPFTWHPTETGLRPIAKYDFILDPGDYCVRLIVRDSSSRRFFSQAQIVQIP
jgi:VWFA-related protein